MEIFTFDKCFLLLKASSSFLMETFTFDKCSSAVKSKETSAVHVHSKTGDEGSIYAARQGMRAVYMQQDR